MSAEAMSAAELVEQARARLEVAWNRAAATGTPSLRVAAGRQEDAWYLADVASKGDVVVLDREPGYVDEIEGGWCEWVMAREAEFTAVGEVDPLGRPGREICGKLAAEDEVVMAGIDAGRLGPAAVQVHSTRQAAELKLTVRLLVGVRAGMVGEVPSVSDPATDLGLMVGRECRSSVERIRVALDGIPPDGVSARVRDRIGYEAKLAGTRVVQLAFTPEEWSKQPGDTLRRISTTADSFDQRCQSAQVHTSPRPVRTGPEVVR